MIAFLSFFPILLPLWLETHYSLAPTHLGAKGALIALILTSFFNTKSRWTLLPVLVFALALYPQHGPTIALGFAMSFVLDFSLKREPLENRVLGGALVLLLSQVAPGALFLLLIPLFSGLACLILLPGSLQALSLGVFALAWLPLLKQTPQGPAFGRALAHYSEAQYFSATPPLATTLKSLPSQTAVFPLPQTPQTREDRVSPWFIAFVESLGIQNAFALFEGPDHSAWVIVSPNPRNLRRRLLKAPAHPDIPLASVLLSEKYSWRDKNLYSSEIRPRSYWIPFFNQGHSFPENPRFKTFWLELARAQAQRFQPSELKKSIRWFLRHENPLKAFQTFMFARQEFGSGDPELEVLGLKLLQHSMRPDILAREAMKISDRWPDLKTLSHSARLNQKLLKSLGFFGLEFDHENAVGLYDQLRTLEPANSTWLEQSLIHQKLKTLPSLLYEKPGCDTGCGP